MQVVFDSLMDTHIVPFFKANGFETQDINSDTNKTLGIQSHYFYKKRALKSSQGRRQRMLIFSIGCVKMTAFGSNGRLKNGQKWSKMTFILRGPLQQNRA